MEKNSDEENGNLCLELDDEKDKIPLAILCSRLQLPESMTFEEYVKFVNIESNVRADEQLTETAVNQDEQGRTTTDLEEEES